LCAIPSEITHPDTTIGVSAANVVATIDVPSAHHGRFRPDRKYSLRSLPARFAYQSPTPVVISSVST